MMEKKCVILSQNRLHLFEGFKNTYLYDSFSQNLYPISQTIVRFFTSDANFYTKKEIQEIQNFCNHLLKWDGTIRERNTGECHVTINMSNRCNLNCSYCYRDKKNFSSIDAEKACEFIEYAKNLYMPEAKEIVCSMNLTSEPLLEIEKLSAINEKLADYEDVSITEKDVKKGSVSDLLVFLKESLYSEDPLQFTGNHLLDIDMILSDKDLYLRFKNSKVVTRILEEKRVDVKFVDRKRLRRINRILLETFYPDYLVHKDFQFCTMWFMSNGTLLSDESIRLIKNLNISPFWVSIDGPEEIHDMHRPYADGGLSHADVIKNIELLKKNGVKIRASCVITKDYPEPQKLMNYFKSLEVDSVQMTPVRNGIGDSFSPETIEVLKTNYLKLYQQIDSEVLQGDYSSIRILREDLSIAAIVNFLSRIRLSSRCTWGREIVLDAKGDMYPCLYVIGNEKYRLGNYSEGKSSDEVLKKITVNDRAECKNCWARYLCGGTCHYNSIASGKSEFDKDEIECSLRKFLIEESLKLIIHWKESGVDFGMIAAMLK